jgi:hypothetical protein
MSPQRGRPPSGTQRRVKDLPDATAWPVPSRRPQITIRPRARIIFNPRRGQSGRHPSAHHEAAARRSLAGSRITRSRTRTPEPYLPTPGPVTPTGAGRRGSPAGAGLPSSRGGPGDDCLGHRGRGAIRLDHRRWKSAAQADAPSHAIKCARNRQGVRSRCGPETAVLLAALSRIVAPTPARSAPGPGSQAMMSSLPQFRSKLLEPT